MKVRVHDVAHRLVREFPDLVDELGRVEGLRQVELSPFEAVRAGEEAEDVIERSVLQHEHDDVINFRWHVVLQELRQVENERGAGISVS